MATFFDELNRPMRELARIADAVRRDVGQFDPAVIARYRELFKEIGTRELGRQYDFLAGQHFPNGNVPELFPALRDRHQNRWNQTIQTAFSTALDSVPEVPSPFRAKVKPGGPLRSILARLSGVLFRESTGRTGRFPRAEEFPEPGVGKDGGRELYALIRANRQVTREVKLKLVPYLRQLIRVAPRNFSREFRGFLVKASAPAQGTPIYKISPGSQHNSCLTCLTLNGRVMTQDALRFATTSLQPQLFHPNCKHIIQVAALRGVTAETYDGKHGDLVTMAEIRRLISRGKLVAGKKRQAFVNV